ncbi:MAG: hypothetical protein QM783_06905 [Phycisphaerales bacterium]
MSSTVKPGRSSRLSKCSRMCESPASWPTARQASTPVMPRRWKKPK